MNQELPNVQTGFKKGRRTKDQIANICWIIEKAREFQKNIYFCFSDYTSKPGFSNTWTENFQMFNLVLEKAEKPEIKLPVSAGPSKKQESARKTSISALLTTPKPSNVWITINCGKFLKRLEYQTTWHASWETCMQVRKQQLELDMGHRLVPNRKRSKSRLYIVTLLI